MTGTTTEERCPAVRRLPGTTGRTIRRDSSVSGVSGRECSSERTFHPARPGSPTDGDVPATVRHHGNWARPADDHCTVTTRSPAVRRTTATVLMGAVLLAA